MSWQPPAFVEIRMDAEISAYQDEIDPVRNHPVVLPETAPTEKPPSIER